MERLPWRPKAVAPQVAAKAPGMVTLAHGAAVTDAENDLADSSIAPQKLERSLLNQLWSNSAYP